MKAKLEPIDRIIRPLPSRATLAGEPSLDREGATARPTLLDAELDAV